MGWGRNRQQGCGGRGLGTHGGPKGPCLPLLGQSEGWGVGSRE